MPEARHDPRSPRVEDRGAEAGRGADAYPGDLTEEFGVRRGDEPSVDRLAGDPHGRLDSDLGLRDRVQHELAEHEAIDAFDMDINVVAGVVTLEGSIASVHTKGLAGDLAAAVPGVDSVRNRLVVTGGTPADEGLPPQRTIT